MNVLDIAHRLGLRVYKVNDWQPDVSGSIRRDEKRGGESGYAIFINADHSPKRQRFTIAHEIAHYILHQDLIGDGITDDSLYRSSLRNRQETQANQLAADILMPWKLINRHPPQEWSVKSLADELDVSESALSIRLGVPVEN